MTEKGIVIPAQPALDQIGGQESIPGCTCCELEDVSPPPVPVKGKLRKDDGERPACVRELRQEASSFLHRQESIPGCHGAVHKPERWFPAFARMTRKGMLRADDAKRASITAQKPSFLRRQESIPDLPPRSSQTRKMVPRIREDDGKKWLRRFCEGCPRPDRGD